MNSTSRTLLLANEVEIHFDSDPHRIGIGEVHIGRTLLRNGRRPMFAEIRSPNGVLMTSPRLLQHEKSADGAHRLRFALDRLDGGPMEFMLHTCRPRVNTADWTLGPQPSDATLELEILPASRTVGKDRYVGFAYRYRYRSEDVPIYKILDRGTWEIGGSILGEEFWMRNGIVPSIFAFDSAETHYSTEWYLPPIAQPNIFQFFPLQTAMQGFTLTHSDDGTLWTWPTEVAHVRSLFEKKRGETLLEHWHEHCADLASDFTTSWMEVLWSPAKGLDYVQRVNRWEAVRDHVWTELHRQIGMVPDRVTTYGVVEEWGTPDFERYTRLGVPKLLEAGVRTIFIPSEFENNMNTWGVSNMCCQVDLKVSEKVGKERLHDFCVKAQEGGARVEMWGNTALSTLAYIFNMPNGDADRIRFLPKKDSFMEAIDRSRQPYVRNLYGGVEADHYTPVFCALNLRDSEVRAYWDRRWHELLQEVGVTGVFIDSSFNLSSDKFHYIQNDEYDRPGGATIDQSDLLGGSRPVREPRQAVQSQYRAYLDLIVAMQRMGYAVSTEDVGLFNVSRSGPDVLERLPSLPLWQESFCTYDPIALRRAGHDPDAVFFRGLAYRVMWNLYWDIASDELSWHHGAPRDNTDRPTSAQKSLLQAFNLLSDGMRNRTVLPKEAGVLYDGSLWAFDDGEVDLGRNRRVTNLHSGESWNDRHLKFRALTPYQLGE